MAGVIGMLALLCVLGVSGPVSADQMNPNTDWMVGKMAAFMHYLPKEDERHLVERFDVAGLKRQLVSMGVDCFMFALGQNNNFYNAPNATYARIAGSGSPTAFSKRDLPAEIIAALKGTGIRFGLYSPCQPSFRDETAERAFGFEPMHPGTPGDWYVTDCGVERWASVVEEWALRYGSDVSIWWFDGARPDMRFTERHGRVLRNALLRANPSMVMSFNFGAQDWNPSLLKDFESVCEQDPSFAERMPFRTFKGSGAPVAIRRWIESSDYISGEIAEPFRFMPDGRWFDGNQFFVLTYLGHYWRDGHSRYPDDIWIRFLREYREKGGMIAFDMAVDHSTGLFCAGQVAQMRRIVRALQVKSASHQSQDLSDCPKQ